MRVRGGDGDRGQDQTQMNTVCEALGHFQPEVEASLAWLSLGGVGGLLSPLLMRSRYRGVIAEH